MIRKQDGDITAINLMLQMSRVFDTHVKAWNKDGNVLSEKGWVMVRAIEKELNNFKTRYGYKVNEKSQENLVSVLEQETSKYKDELMRTMAQIMIIYGTINSFSNQLLSVSLKECIRDVFRAIRPYNQMWLVEVEETMKEYL